MLNIHPILDLIPSNGYEFNYDVIIIVLSRVQLLSAIFRPPIFFRNQQRLKL